MAEPLKDMYNHAFFDRFCSILIETYPAFDKNSFLQMVFDQEWGNRELKQRVRHITQSLHQSLNLEYKEAIEILSSIVERCRGFEYMFFPDYIEVYGQDDLQISIPTLALFTPSSSSEFAIRPFIQQHPELMMKHMLDWAKHPDHHVRRLSSEGCRPKLPWGIALKMFQHNPAPILPILEQLKEDESEYVRKSVANNLNDISKDHPELLLELAGRWVGQHPHTDAILKHGLRGLLKKGSARALTLFGFDHADEFEIDQLSVSHQAIQIGESLKFSFIIRGESNTNKKLRMEYMVDYMKANGKHSSKVFQISESTFTGGERMITRKQSFRELTTRKHYPGPHRITIIVNGQSKASVEFELIRD